MTTRAEETLKTERGYLLKGLSLATSIGLAISSYFLADCYTRLGAVESNVINLRIDAATVSSNRFTSGDFVKAKSQIDEVQLQNERRILTLEEHNKSIQALLQEIRADVKELNSK